jgi:hypothetical protein
MVSPRRSDKGAVEHRKTRDDRKIQDDRKILDDLETRDDREALDKQQTQTSRVYTDVMEVWFPGSHGGPCFHVTSLGQDD